MCICEPRRRQIAFAMNPNTLGNGGDDGGGGGAKKSLAQMENYGMSESEKPIDWVEVKQEEKAEIFNDESSGSVQEVEVTEVKTESVEDRIATAVSAGICIRNGCKNKAITNVEWEDEFCSNECAVFHCKDIFSSWVASKNPTS